jgi:hypothetical protein
MTIGMILMAFILLPIIIMFCLSLKILLLLVTVPLVFIILILVAVHLCCDAEIKQGCTKTIICKGSNNKGSVIINSKNDSNCTVSSDGIYIDGKLIKCKCGKKACNVESCDEDLEAYCNDCY